MLLSASVRAPGVGRGFLRGNNVHRARACASRAVSARAPRVVRVNAAAAEAETKSAREEGLAFMLDDGTRKSHSMAENSAFIQGFFKGIAEKEAFAQLVAGLYFVYEAMEDSFSTTSDPRVRSLDFPALRRVASLEDDLAYFYGPEWRATVKPTQAAEEYVARVREVAEKEPILLVAHQYTRYLGDLFGGQMMGGMATRSLGLEGGKGVSFYSFSDIPSVKEFIEEWYSALNALDIPDETKTAIVDEANLVFTLNIGLFGELEGSAASSVWRLIVSGLKEKLGLAPATSS